MDDLTFDIYAMVKPKTQADFKLLLDEALLEAENLLEAWRNLGQALRQQEPPNETRS